MNIGGTRRCKLPAKLAYGATGYPKSGDKAGIHHPAERGRLFSSETALGRAVEGLGFGLDVISVRLL